MRAELQAIKLNPSNGAVLHSDEFVDSISRWVHHVRQVMNSDAMDDNADFSPYKCVEASQAEVNATKPDAMHDVQDSLPEYVKECLGKPLSTSASKFLKISDETRAEGLARILQVIKSTNEAAKIRCKNHLLDHDLMYFSQNQESYVMKKLHDDVWELPDRPSKDQIEEVYCHLINKKSGICGILTDFVKKVKKFHNELRKVARKVLKPVGNKVMASFKKFRILIDQILHSLQTGKPTIAR